MREILILKPGEICKNEDCQFAKYDTFTNSICPGKDFKRDYDFTCDLSDVIDGNKRGLIREAKQFAEAVARRNERRERS